jgi:hypothetical protein
MPGLRKENSGFESLHNSSYTDSLMKKEYLRQIVRSSHPQAYEPQDDLGQQGGSTTR